MLLCQSFPTHSAIAPVIDVSGLQRAAGVGGEAGVIGRTRNRVPTNPIFSVATSLPSAAPQSDTACVRSLDGGSKLHETLSTFTPCRRRHIHLNSYQAQSATQQMSLAVMSFKYTGGAANFYYNSVVQIMQ